MIEAAKQKAQTTVPTSASMKQKAQTSVPDRETVKEAAVTALPPREILVHGAVIVAVLAIASMTGLGSESSEDDLVNMLQSIGDFISLIILGVAVPNGAYGFLQYMTAGSNVDQDEKGRKRIRNTFVGLAGVAVIQVAVSVFESMIMNGGSGS